jgi:hypothetical protein
VKNRLALDLLVKLLLFAKVIGNGFESLSPRNTDAIFKLIVFEGDLRLPIVNNQMGVFKGCGRAIKEKGMREFSYP